MFGIKSGHRVVEWMFNAAKNRTLLQRIDVMVEFFDEIEVVVEKQMLSQKLGVVAENGSCLKKQHMFNDNYKWKLGAIIGISQHKQLLVLKTGHRKLLLWKMVLKLGVQEAGLLIRILFRSNWEDKQMLPDFCVYYLCLDFDFTIPSHEVQTWLLRLRSLFFRVEK